MQHSSGSIEGEELSHCKCGHYSYKWHHYTHRCVIAFYCEHINESMILHLPLIWRLERFLWPLDGLLLARHQLPYSRLIGLLCCQCFQYSCAPFSLFMIHSCCLIVVLFPVVITLRFVPHFLEGDSNDSPPSCHISDMWWTWEIAIITPSVSPCLCDTLCLGAPVCVCVFQIGLCGFALQKHGNNSRKST